MSTVLRDAFSITRLSFWTGIALSCLVSAMAYMVTARSIESGARTRFHNYTKHAQNVIEARIKSYTDLLRGTASMIYSTDKLTYRQFRAYVRNIHLERNFPAVGYINYAVYITDRDRADFVKRMRADIQADFVIRDNIDITPPGHRQNYLPVAYIEPPPPSAKLYGIDILANRYFGNQLIEERDSGKVFSSGTPMPILSRPNDTYIGMRMPVYRLGEPISSIEQRRAAYAGSLGIAFNIPRLLEGVIDTVSLPGVHMILYDVGPHITEHGRISYGHELLFDSLGTIEHPKVPLETGDDVFSVTLPLDFNGRPWKTVYSVSKSALCTDFDIWYPKLMMIFAFLGSILLYTLLYTLTSSRRAALELAQEMTSELRESQGKLQLSHQKLRRLADHAYQIKELERKRIAREIHDDLGQNLLALRIEVEMLATRTKARHSRLHERVVSTLQQIDIVIKSVRQIINDLRPTVLDLGLSAAVEWQVKQFQRRTGIACEIHDDHGEIWLPDHCATAFFRILQESLTNIVRHANATKVMVDLRLNDGWLSMTVRDNGCGLQPGERNKLESFGLVGIEERVVILGGTCAIISELGDGTTIMVSAPVAEIPEHALQSQQRHTFGPSVV